MAARQYRNRRLTSAAPSAYPRTMHPAHIVLSGPPGSGKSTIGPRLAERLGYPYVDLDRLVEDRAGRSAAEVFERDGEFTFRALERAAFEDALAGGTVVIAAGGGALVDRAWRRAVLDRAAVVGLTAPAEVLASRLAGAHGRPLLAGGDLRASLDRLLDLRRDAYPEAHCVVDTSHVAADDAPERILASLASSVPVWLGERSYRVRFEPFASLREGLVGRRCVVVSDRNVARHHRGLWTRALRGTFAAEAVVTPGEASKNFRSLRLLWRRALAASLDRDGVFVCVGGGVVSDLGGFAAATLLRGVRYVTAPTSTLAMLDASIGGKTAIDLPEGKNLVGSFHQPSDVCVDPSFLATLPLRHHRAGLAEALKVALTSDASLLDHIDANAATLAASTADPALAGVLRRAVAIKAAVVSRDEREGGERAALNFGHTLGHAIESALGYRLLHGECVALGMIAECAVGEALGLTAPSLTARVARVVEALSLPTRVAAREDAVVARLARDKKRAAGNVRVVIVGEPGRWQLVPVAEEHLRAGLRRVLRAKG
jgi:shikimate kinase/3-dehydroquinate synthase